VHAGEGALHFPLVSRSSVWVGRGTFNLNKEAARGSGLGTGVGSLRISLLSVLMFKCS
jgi:hypothetical protein